MTKEANGPLIFLKVPDLKPVWAQEMNAAYPGEWHDLAPREKGILARIGQRLADTKMLFEMEDLIRHAIKNWSRFTAKAKSDEGAFGIPNMPAVDFLEKHLRAAVNLYLKDNNLEFSGFAVRSKEKPTCSDLGSVNAQRESVEEHDQAPVHQRIFRDVPYDPPPFACGPREWLDMSVDQRQADLERYVERHLKPYNAQYMAGTGELPRLKMPNPLNADAFLRDLITAGFAVDNSLDPLTLESADFVQSTASSAVEGHCS